MSYLSRRFFRLSLINIASTVTVPLVGLVDTAMLGHLPEIRFLAGVALASLLFDYIYWTLGFLRMSTTGMTAQAVGRKDGAEIGRVLHRSLLIALVLGAAVLAFQVPLREAGFALLSGEPSVEQAGRDYFNARIWGAPAALSGFVLLGWFLGRAESRYVLVMTVVANLSNVLLNYVFIVRLGMAARGAGLASMLSQYLMLAVGWAIYMRRRQPVPWCWAGVLDRSRMAALFRLNRDILLRTLCLVSSFALFVNSSSVLGTLFLAANSILLRLQALASYLIDGTAFASESLAGIFRGQRDIRALQRLFRLSLATGLGLALLFLAGLFAAERPILRLLTSHDDVIATSAAYAGWLVPVLLFGSLAYMYDGLFLGLTEGRRLRNAMLFSTFVVFLPACGAALWLGDNHALWAAMALFMLARTATLWVASRGALALPVGEPGVR
jgi:MATE family multidrug resistance protein